MVPVVAKQLAAQSIDGALAWIDDRIATDPALVSQRDDLAGKILTPESIESRAEVDELLESFADDAEMRTAAIEATVGTWVKQDPEKRNAMGARTTNRSRASPGDPFCATALARPR